MSTPLMERTKEPSVYKRGGRYVYVWKHRGKQYKSSHRTMAEARAAKRQRQGGDRRKRPRVLFRDYAPTWIESYRGRTARGFSETTRREYRRDLESHLLPYFGGYLLDEIEAPDVRDWFGWMESRGASGAAISKAKATLSALMGTALEDGKVRRHPVVGVRFVPSGNGVPRRKLRPLTMEELGRFMRALPPEWRLLFGVLTHTGLRIGEALGLRWAHVHLGDDAHLTICEQVYHGERKRLKTTNSNRTVPLSPALARALTEWRERTPYPGADSPVFASKAGTPLDYGGLHRRVLTPARDAAGIPAEEVGAFHAFRRTFGSLVHASGQKTDRQLCDLLGHHDPAFTMRVYVGTMDDGVGKADFLDDLIPLEEWATDGQPAIRK
jgi:integrase